MTIEEQVAKLETRVATVEAQLGDFAIRKSKVIVKYAKRTWAFFHTPWGLVVLVGAALVAGHLLKL